MIEWFKQKAKENIKKERQAFYYKDNVKIVDGFYKGQKGIVVKKYWSQSIASYKYEVKLADKTIIKAYSCELEKILGKIIPSKGGTGETKTKIK